MYHAYVHHILTYINIQMHLKRVSWKSIFFRYLIKIAFRLSCFDFDDYQNCQQLQRNTVSLAIILASHLNVSISHSFSCTPIFHCLSYLTYTCSHFFSLSQTSCQNQIAKAQCWLLDLISGCDDIQYVAYSVNILLVLLFPKYIYSQPLNFDLKIRFPETFTLYCICIVDFHFNQRDFSIYSPCYYSSMR